MEKVTMLEQEENVYGEIIEWEYLIPIKAVEEYLDTRNKEEIKSFLTGEYNSEDTDNVISNCIRLKLDYEIVSEQII